MTGKKGAERGGGTLTYRPPLPWNLHPHPRRGRGLSRNEAGEAGSKSRGTLHPNRGEVRKKIRDSSLRSRMTQGGSDRDEVPHPAAVPIFLSSGAEPVLSEAEGGHPWPWRRQRSIKPLAGAAPANGQGW